MCPEHIKITDNAIIPLKERVVDASYDPVAWLGRKILNRTKRSPAEASADSPAPGPVAVQSQPPAHGIPAPGPSSVGASARSRLRRGDRSRRGSGHDLTEPAGPVPPTAGDPRGDGRWPGS